MTKKAYGKSRPDVRNDAYYPPEIEGETDGDGFPPIRIAREEPKQSAGSGRQTVVADDSESDQHSNNEEEDVGEDQLESDNLGIEKMTKRDLIKELPKVITHPRNPCPALRGESNYTSGPVKSVMNQKMRARSFEVSDSEPDEQVPCSAQQRTGGMVVHQKPHVHHVDESDSDTNVTLGVIDRSKTSSGAGFGADNIFPAGRDIIPAKPSKNEPLESQFAHLAEQMYENFDHLRTSSPEHSENEESQGIKVSTKPLASGCATRPSHKGAREIELPKWRNQHQPQPVAARSARPRVKATVISMESELQWPASTRLILDGNKLKITKQSQSVRVVISQTIFGMQAALALDNPFPDNIERDIMIKKVMRTVVKGLIEELGDEFTEIFTRLREDVNYAATLSVPVQDRVSIYRGYLKAACASTIVLMYNLRDASKETVKELIDKNTYIFPTNPNSNEPKRNKPYQHPAIIHALAQFLLPKGKLFLQDKYHARFKSESGRSPSPTPSLIAFATTGVYASLVEWESGSHGSADFTANRFISAYRMHIDILESIKSANPQGYEKMMADLYSLARNNQAFHSMKQGSVAGFIDIDGLDVL